MSFLIKILLPTARLIKRSGLSTAIDDLSPALAPTFPFIFSPNPDGLCFEPSLPDVYGLDEPAHALSTSRPLLHFAKAT